MEILVSARSSSEFAALERELDALRVLRNDRAVTDAAMSAYRELAGHRDGYHRVPVTDALIAAAEHGNRDQRSLCSIVTRTSIGSPRFSRSRA
jgi:predicted nucleic acid-binding protein